MQAKILLEILCSCYINVREILYIVETKKVTMHQPGIKPDPDHSDHDTDHGAAGPNH